MGGDLSVTTSSGSDHYNTSPQEFQNACARAGSQYNAGESQATTSASANTSSAVSSSSETTTLLPPGVSVDGATDALDKGSELYTSPEPPTRTVDQRIAWHERWLARTEAFFNDANVLGFLDSAQVAQMRADLKSYRDQLVAFKSLVAKYRAEGKEPSEEEIKAAFGGMREVRRDLKRMVAEVMEGILKFIIAMVDLACDNLSLLFSSSLTLYVVSYGQQFLSIVGDNSKTELEEARELPFLFRTAFFRLRDLRVSHQ